MRFNRTRTFSERPFTSRLYRSEQDLREMQRLLMEARSQTNDWRFAHVGELNFGFLMVLCHLNPQEHIRLWHIGEGRLVAYAILGEDPVLDFQVLPGVAWSGIEAEAMAWAEELLFELRRRDPDHWGSQLVSGARQDDLERINFLEQHGFRYSGDFAEDNMLRSLDESIPVSALPDGCQVRAFLGSSEIQDRAAAHREVWRPWTVGNVSNEDYARLMQLPGYDCDLDLVAVTSEGIIAASVNGWVDPFNRIGDFGPVGARHAYRRQGYTRAALLEGLRRMKAHGMNRVCISTGISNISARQLYQSIGFKIVNRYLDFVKVV